MLFNLSSRFLYFVSDFLGYLVILILSFTTFMLVIKQIFSSSYTIKKKQMLAMGAVFLFLFIIFYSCAEAYLRYRYDESDSLGFLKVTGRWLKRHVVYNNYFYRDRDFGPKKPGTLRIGILGDSMTLGYGIKNVDYRFSNILEHMLKQKNSQIEVYNLGQSGADTQQEVENYDKVKHLDFDIVIWQYFLNDAEPKDKSKGARVLVRSKYQGEIARLLSDKSYFFDYVYWRLETRYDKTFKELRNADMDAYRDEENFKRHTSDVKNFISMLKKDNKKIIVVVLPFFAFFPNYPAYDIHKMVHVMFEESGIQPIDLLDDLKNKNSKDLLVSHFDYHPNEMVQKIIAKRLYDKLLPLINQ